MPHKQQASPFEFINDVNVSTVAKTIIVLGAERSGTSMTAQLLHAMGVSMAPQLNATGQDPEFSRLYYAPLDLESAKKLIELRNKAAIWGWKFPGNVSPALYNLTRSPHFIVMLRDPLALARRIQKAEDWRLAPAIRRVSEQQASIAEFIASTKSPVLLIHYDSSLQHPEQLIKTVAEFSGIQLSHEKMTAAKSVIKPGNPAYEKASSASTLHCHIETLGPDNILGWARNRTTPETPVKIHLRIDGHLVESITANHYRADLEDSLMGNGRWAFSIPLATHLADSLAHTMELSVASEELCTVVYKAQYQK